MDICSRPSGLDSGEKEMLLAVTKASQCSAQEEAFVKTAEADQGREHL